MLSLNSALTHTHRGTHTHPHTLTRFCKNQMSLSSLLKQDVVVIFMCIFSKYSIYIHTYIHTYIHKWVAPY